MLTAERRRLILEALAREGQVRAAELSSQFAVSEDTIRRDLRDLADSGLLQRVHGGALPRSPVSASYTARREQSVPAKEAIAKAAAMLFRDHQVIAVDGGTTPLRVVEHFPPDLRATVVTHSVPAALALCERPMIEVILVGGRLFKESREAVGAMAVEAYRSIRPDVCVLGLAGLHAEVGITVLDGEDAHVKRAMLEGASVIVAVASAEKLGTVSPYVVAPASRLSHLVTDCAESDERLVEFRQLGMQIITP